MAQNKLITINLRKYLASQPRNKRARKAMLLVREQVSRLAKVKPENIKVSQNLNSLIFKRYSKKLTPIKLNVSIDKERVSYNAASGLCVVLPMDDVLLLVAVLRP